LVVFVLGKYVIYLHVQVLLLLKSVAVQVFKLIEMLSNMKVVVYCVVSFLLEVSDLDGHIPDNFVFQTAYLVELVQLDVAAVEAESIHL
jgi:hypothetical protein